MGTPKHAKAAVDEFLAALSHPLKPEIRRVRSLLLGIDDSIREEIKWNSLSFRNQNDFFATLHLRSLSTLQIVLHTGVEKKSTAQTGIPVEDPRGLIAKWAAKDRCVLALGKGPTFAANEAALVVLVRSWRRFV